jgi:hypothetical protein
MIHFQMQPMMHVRANVRATFLVEKKEKCSRAFREINAYGYMPYNIGVALSVSGGEAS